MVSYLEQERMGQVAEPPTRYARVEVSIKKNPRGTQLFELIVDLDNNSVVKKQHVEGKHSYIDTNFMKAVEEACLADEKVQAEIKTLDIPDGAIVVVEPWAYATDGMNDMTDRVTMVYHILYQAVPQLLMLFSVGFTCDCWRTQMQTTMPTLWIFAPKYQSLFKSQKCTACRQRQTKESIPRQGHSIVAESTILPRANIIPT